MKSNKTLEISQSILVALCGMTVHSLKGNTSTTLEESMNVYIGLRICLGPH